MVFNDLLFLEILPPYPHLHLVLQYIHTYTITNEHYTSVAYVSRSVHTYNVHMYYICMHCVCMKECGYTGMIGMQGSGESGW